MTPIAHTAAVRGVRGLLWAVALSAALLAVGCKTPPAPGGGGGGATSSTSSDSSSGKGGAATVPQEAPPSSTPPTSPAAESQAGGGTTSLPSPSEGSDQGSGSGRAQTTEERRASIDKRFDDSLGTFDRELRKEQEKNAQERDARVAANVGTVPASDDAETGAADKGEGEADSGGSAGTEGPRDKADEKSDRPTRRPGDLRSDKDNKSSNGGKSSGSSPQSGSGSGASEIPDGSDDDVVARRLRKAAEAETDPELKEKLWKEYIEYKKNAK